MFNDVNSSENPFRIVYDFFNSFSYLCRHCILVHYLAVCLTRAATAVVVVMFFSLPSVCFLFVVLCCLCSEMSGFYFNASSEPYIQYFCKSEMTKCTVYIAD